MIKKAILTALVSAILAIPINVCALKAPQANVNVLSENVNVIVEGTVDSSHYDQNITLALISGNGNLVSSTPAQIGYVAQTKIDQYGKYRFLFKFNKFTFDQSGVVNNYKLYLNLNGQLLTPSITQINAMATFNLKFEPAEVGVKASLSVDDVFSLWKNNRYTLVLAFYDEQGELLKTTYKESAAMYDDISDVAPARTKTTRVFAWTSLDNVIPLCEYVDYQKDLYVDYDNGNDNNIGTKQMPLKTINRAVDIVRENVTDSAKNTTIHLAEGVHRLDKTVSLDWEHFSNEQSQLKIKSESGQKVTVTDGVVMDNSKFQPVPGKPYYSYQFPAIAEGYPKFRNLLVNGKRAVLARSGDDDNLYMFDPEVKSMYSTNKGFSNNLYVDSELFSPEKITQENLGSLELHRYVQWLQQIYKVESISGLDSETGYTIIKVDQDQWDENNAQWWTELRNFAKTMYWFQNHLALLDRPGEFYYDDTAGILYYYPREGENISTALFEYCPLEKLFELNGKTDRYVSNVSFDGITFTGLSYNQLSNGRMASQSASDYSQQHAAIYATHIKNTVVSNCSFVELGGGGFVLYNNGYNTIVRDSYFKNIGLHAFRYGNISADRTLASTENRSNQVLFQNNYIENNGMDLKTCVAVHVGKINNARILNNTIKNVPYSAISIGWHTNAQETDRINIQNSEVAYNMIENSMNTLYDGAAIYTLGSNHLALDQQYNITVHDNYVIGGLIGTYSDNTTSDAHLYNNVIKNVDLPISLQTGSEQSRVRDILVENIHTIGNPISQESYDKYEQLLQGRNVIIRNVTHYETDAALPDVVKSIINNAGCK